jgi:hypothetical protein
MRLSHKRPLKRALSPKSAHYLLTAAQGRQFYCANLKEVAGLIEKHGFIELLDRITNRKLEQPRYDRGKWTTGHPASPLGK